MGLQVLNRHLTNSKTVCRSPVSSPLNVKARLARAVRFVLRVDTVTPTDTLGVRYPRHVILEMQCLNIMLCAIFLSFLLKSRVTSWVIVIYLSHFCNNQGAWLPWITFQAVRRVHGCELAFQNLLQPRVGGLFPFSKDSAGCKEASVQYHLEKPCFCCGIFDRASKKWVKRLREHSGSTWNFPKLFKFKHFGSMSL